MLNSIMILEDRDQPKDGTAWSAEGRRCAIAFSPSLIDLRQ
ncbi:MAG: hypothetical protein AB4372_18515 [Xenococcus sp. (in: cyanobacteria)]